MATGRSEDGSSARPCIREADNPPPPPSPLPAGFTAGADRDLCASGLRWPGAGTATRTSED
jgi:hypothetical protein